MPPPVMGFYDSQDGVPNAFTEQALCVELQQRLARDFTVYHAQ